MVTTQYTRQSDNNSPTPGHRPSQVCNVNALIYEYLKKAFTLHTYNFTFTPNGLDGPTKSMTNLGQFRK